MYSVATKRITPSFYFNKPRCNLKHIIKTLNLEHFYPLHFKLSTNREKNKFQPNKMLHLATIRFRVQNSSSCLIIIVFNLTKKKINSKTAKFLCIGKLIAKKSRINKSSKNFFPKQSPFPVWNNIYWRKLEKIRNNKSRKVFFV